MVLLGPCGPLFFFVAFFAALLCSGLRTIGSEVFYNYDGWNLFYYGADDSSISKGLAPLASNGVTTVMLSPNVGQTFVCPSSNQITMFNSGVPLTNSDLYRCMSAPYPAFANNVVQRWVNEGVDPFGRAVTIAKSMGMKVVLSFRLNDIHGLPCPNSPNSDPFYQDNPQFQTTIYPSSPTLDFSNLEVREYRVDQIGNLLGRYQFDGVELDFLRSFPFFNDPDGSIDTTNMTAFVYRVATLVAGINASMGSNIKLYVRVPSTLAGCVKVGLDPINWAQNGYIDGIIVGKWLRQSPELDISDFKRGAPGTPVYASLDYILSWPGYGAQPTPAGHRLATRESYRGISSALYAKGADGIYLFNMYSTRTDNNPSSYVEPFDVLAQLGSPTLLANSDRLFLATARDDIDLRYEYRPNLTLPSTSLGQSQFPLEAELDTGIINTNASYTLRLIGPNLSLNVVIVELNGVRLSQPLNPTTVTLFPETYNTIQPALADCVDFVVPTSLLLVGKNTVTVHVRAPTQPVESFSFGGSVTNTGSVVLSDVNIMANIPVGGTVILNTNSIAPGAVATFSSYNYGPASVTINGIELSSHVAQQLTPAIIGYAKSGDSNKIDILGLSGTKYELQFSQDLKNWFAIDSLVMPDAGVFSFVDVRGSSNQIAFYRVALAH